MTIRDRTNPRTTKPRKSATIAGGGLTPVPRPGLPGLDSLNPRFARPTSPAMPDGGVYMPTNTTIPTLPPAPVPAGPRPLYPAPSPVPTGVVTPGATDGAPATPVLPPLDGGARPLYPEGPTMGIPGGPGSLPVTPPPVPGNTGVVPPGLGLDFMREVTPNELVANQLEALLRSDSPYMRNAEQRGMEYAASRGNINSSIGAGAARRAALEAGMPIAQADAQVYRDANAGNFEALSGLRQMRVAGDIENWLSSESYNREFNGELAMVPIRSSIDMLQYIMQRGMEDPAVYPPDVLSGMSNFFNGNMFDIFNRFFGPQTPGGD